MKKLIKNRETYEQVFHAMESDYEDIVKGQLNHAFPDFIVVNFKTFILGDEGRRRKPDLAMIHCQYKMWCVLEVELIQHSLDHHVFPQMACFSTGDYNKDHAKYIAGQDSRISESDMLRLIDRSQPEVIVVVNSKKALDKEWSQLHSELGVELMFLEVFSSSKDDVIYSLDGYEPRIEPKRITGAQKHIGLNGLFCKKPGSMPVPSSRQVRMAFEGVSVIWKVLPTKDGITLMPPNSIALHAGINYEIRQDSNGGLELRAL